MTTPDYPDWQQPVQAVQSSAALPGSPFTLTDGTATGQIDVSDWESVNVVITCPVQVAGTRYLLSASWYENGVLVNSDEITFHSKNSYPVPLVGKLAWHLPARASSLKFGALSGGAAGFTFLAIGSTRTIDPGRPTISNDGASKVLEDSSFGVVAAAATSASLYLPPVDDQVIFRMNQKIASMQMNVSAVGYNSGGLNISRVATIFGSDPTNAGLAVPVSGQAVELSVTNNDAAGHSTSVSAIDGS